MSLNFNSVTIAGRLGKDPELKDVGQTGKVVSFSVATSRTFKNKAGEKQEETTWLDVEAWGKTAEFIGQYFTKGSAIFIVGRLKTESWETKDNQKRQRIKVVAETVSFVEGKRDGERSDPVPPKKSDHAAKQLPTDSGCAGDEPPF